MRKLWRRTYFLLHRRRLERELTEEMDAHREMMPADRRPHFGNPARLHEDSREVWSWPWLDQLWQDLCYGSRVLSRAPGFTLGAIAVLALGVGVNLAEFQIFDGIMFHRLDVRDAGSLLQFARNSRQGRRLGLFTLSAVCILAVSYRQSRFFQDSVQPDYFRSLLMVLLLPGGTLQAFRTRHGKPGYC